MRGLAPIAALLALPAAAAAQEAEPAIPPEHKAQADRAQAMVDRLEEGDKSGSALTAARALREECLASGNHRSAEFLSGRIVACFPDQLRDYHRHIEILLVRGKRERAERDLRQHMTERPTDCAAYTALSNLLLEQDRPADAMEVQTLHLKEHAGEAGPLYARANIALWKMGDGERARAGAVEMRTAAASGGVRGDVADWLRSGATEIEDGARKRDKDRDILRAASTHLDRVLWAAALAGVLIIAIGGWLTRPRSA